MDIQPSNQIDPSVDSYSSLNKNMVIIILTVIIILSLLGINVFVIIGDVLQKFINVFSPLFADALSGFGYVSGTALNNTTNVLAETSKTGIDILNGTVQSVGDLLIKSSGENHMNINQPPTIIREPPEPTESTNPVLNASSMNKNKWCLVGEYNGIRGCINISDSDKCMSNQVFPSQQLCLNPNLSK
jgi:hypothetical protein